MKDSQFPRVKCYDNGGKTCDRYTAVYLDQPERQHKMFTCVGMSEHPFHPQGFGQHSSAMIGSHLGKRVDSTTLPIDCQKLIKQDLTFR